jgi:atlastin
MLNLQITIEANNLLAISSAREVYVTKMKAICGGDMSFVTARELELYHLEAKEEAIEHFKKAKKMGGNEYAEEFLEKLELEIMVGFLD